MQSFNWYKSQLKRPSGDAPTVYSAFLGAGGSAYGYALAGFKVIGGCDIDNKAIECFKQNHNHFEFLHHKPIKRIINMPNLPDILFNLDILDASPPPSTFASFKKSQTKYPEDLIFDTIALTKKLRPKILVIDTNICVTYKKFKNYTAKIIEALRELGYTTQIFSVDCVDFGVALKKQSAIIIATNIYPLKSPITLPASVVPRITCEEAFQHLLKPLPISDPQYSTDEVIQIYHPLVKKGGCYGKVFQEIRNARAYGNWFKIDNESPCLAMTSHALLTHHQEGRFLSLDEVKAVSSFPMDFHATPQLGKYFIAMASAPFMIKHIAEKTLKPLIPLGGNHPL
jgi:DNA (cytosine-5)-methyltransferase 1